MPEFPKRYTSTSWEVICPECGYRMERECDDEEEMYIECGNCEIELKVSCYVSVEYTATQVIGEDDCHSCEGSGKSKVNPEWRCLSCEGSGKEKLTADGVTRERYEEWRKKRDEE